MSRNLFLSWPKTMILDEYLKIRIIQNSKILTDPFPLQCDLEMDHSLNIVFFNVRKTLADMAAGSKKESMLWAFLERTAILISINSTKKLRMATIDYIRIFSYYIFFLIRNSTVNALGYRVQKSNSCRL